MAIISNTFTTASGRRATKNSPMWFRGSLPEYPDLLADWQETADSIFEWKSTLAAPGPTIQTESDQYTFSAITP